MRNRGPARRGASGEAHLVFNNGGLLFCAEVFKTTLRRQLITIAPIQQDADPGAAERLVLPHMRQLMGKMGAFRERRRLIGRAGPKDARAAHDRDAKEGGVWIVCATQNTHGVEIDGVAYKPIRAELDKTQGENVWITVAITEGKNREVRKVMEHLNLRVNRLIRTGYGPFLLGALEAGALEEIPTKQLREQLGRKICEEIGL